MRTTSTRSQLALRWMADDAVQWDELPPALQAELRALLRRLLVAAARAGRLEVGHDQ